MRWILLISVILRIGSIESVFLDHIVIVDAKTRDCYMEQIDTPQEVDFDFQVIEGGDLDVNFVMFDPRGVVLFADLRQNSNSRTLNLTIPGVYKMCMDNVFSHSSPKKVYFSLRSVDPMLLDEEPKYDALQQDTVLGEQLEQFRDKLRRIWGQMEQLQHHLSSKRSSETRDDYLLRSNLSRVRFWSIGGVACICIVGFLQVYLIRTLFDEQSRIGLVLRKNL